MREVIEAAVSLPAL